MDSNKLNETLNLLKSCESNLRDITSQAKDAGVKLVYKRAAKDIKRVEERIQSLTDNISNETPQFNQLNSDIGRDENIQELPSNADIKSIKVVDSRDIIAPSKLPEL